jgi:hypothetical protein
MAARNNHAAPKCPKCSDGPTKVHNTRHTNDGYIVRFRICNLCGWRFWTKQSQEQVIDPSQTKINIPSWRDLASKHKRITLKPTMNELPLDYTRCMGVTPLCPQRHNCARHRSILFPDRLSWRRNMNDAGLEQQCLAFIPWNKTND